MNKKLLYIIALTTLLNTQSVKAEHFYNINKNYSLDSLEPYADYEDGLIYIGNEMYIDMVSEFATDKDILVIDQRYMDDPNFKVLNSYKITDKSIQTEVINVILAYEKDYPTKWDRTYKSLMNEWYFHNLMYQFNYHTHQTTDVDFNNYDEAGYKKITLQNIYVNFIKNKKK